MIKYNFPDFVLGRYVYQEYFNLRKQYPYAFYEDSEITSIFGMFPNCIWNGGGEFSSPSFCTPAIIKNYFDFYNYELNIPIRLTCTNPVLTSEDFFDSYGNMIVRLGENGKNELLTSIPEFENFLRDRYPNYKYVKSIIGTKDQDVFLDDKYYMSCMKRACNNHWDIIDKIPMEQRDKVEFLCTDPCPDNCPRIYSHYLLHGERQKNYCYSDIDSSCTMNTIKGPFHRKYTTTLHSYISREKIVNDYLPRGFTNFKISGRFNIGGIINNICTYLVKPDYRVDINERLINSTIIHESDMILLR